MQELLTTLDGHHGTIILIERLDRLARDLMIQETILADLQKRGHTLISVAEPDLCQDDPSRKLMRQIFGAIAEYDRSMIVLKLRGARQRTKAKTGRCEGRYGFGRDPKLPDEGYTLNAILARRRSGDTCEDIAAHLNSNGLTSRSGKPWRGTVVAKIIRRERDRMCGASAVAAAPHNAVSTERVSSPDSAHVASSIKGKSPPASDV